MGDPLQELEKRLELMVPQGLSDQGRDRLEEQIEQLASEVEASRSGWPWQRLAALAASLILIAGVVVVSGRGGDDETPNPVAKTDVPETSLPEFERLEHRREFTDPNNHRIVLTRFNEPMHSWNYKVREFELILDPVSGFRVEMVTESEEEVRTAVTSF